MHRCDKILILEIFHDLIFRKKPIIVTEWNINLKQNFNRENRFREFNRSSRKGESCGTIYKLKQ